MTTATARVRRVEVRPAPGAGDPRADALVREARALGFAPAAVRTARVYLIEADLDEAQIGRVIAELLADPVTERATIGAAGSPADGALIEVHPLPGVMDPAAGSVADAIRTMLGGRPRVSTGWRYELAGLSPPEARRLGERLLANPVVHAIHADPFCPDALPEGHETPFRVAHVEVTGLGDAGLEKLSREGHLFLSLDEMRAVRDEFRRLGREPTDVELETLAQTWSEHCVHKTLKSKITYTRDPQSPGIPIPGLDVPAGIPRPGHTLNPDGSVTIDNLLKSTVAAATHELIAGGVDWALSVFVDNAGIIAFDDDHAVCVKVETHNHPSAIEPYGGAATGIGGCIRDVIGTGLAAKPIASTDVFCVAPPDAFSSSLSHAGERAGVRGAPGAPAPLPPGCLHPRRVLSQVVAGVRDYGNRMGIPTVNGAVWFDDRYVGNPLVYCGCVGVMPRGKGDAMIRGTARPGDRIIALGGRTGRDGIHGATFSSAELTDTHADEFAHAVQIGNAIEERRVLDAVLRARDAHKEPGASATGPLFHAITDCGAGGFSSAVGEMGEKLGAEVHLDRAPLKYAGLTYTEIWISEAQERMVLAVPAANVPALRRICDEEHVELAELGHFGTDGAELVLNYHGTEVGRLPMAFLHDGIPTPTREAHWSPSLSPAGERAGVRGSPPSPSSTPPLRDTLLTLLAHPNIASKHWIIRQYDHEVQGNTVVRPLVGPRGIGPADAAVIEPVTGTGKGLAIGCGLATGLEADPYAMTLAAIDECVRNLVCVGADPDRIAILDNFCWPSCARPENLGSLVRAAEGCYDGALAYRTPFVSGKDSLNNQFTIPAADGKPARTIEIPPTLLITGIGTVPDIEKCVTSDAKRAGHDLLLVTGCPTPHALGASHYERLFGASGLETGTGASPAVAPRLDLTAGPRAARFVAGLIASGRVHAAHDVSDGGPLVALAEMLIGAADIGRSLGASVGFQGAGPDAAELFAEPPHTYLLEVDPLDDGALDELTERADALGILAMTIGELTDDAKLSVGTSRSGEFECGVDDLARAWRGTLDW